MGRIGTSRSGFDTETQVRERLGYLVSLSVFLLAAGAFKSARRPCSVCLIAGMAPRSRNGLRYLSYRASSGKRPDAGRRRLAGPSVHGERGRPRLLALTAIDRGEWRLALLWLLAALAVDGVDGTLARLARVKEHAPRIDGEAFDLIVDYLNYVFVPAIFICRAGLVPAALALPLAAAILLSSVYVFVRRDMKTKDNYFRGFPALWNVVALYLFAAQPGPGRRRGRGRPSSPSSASRRSASSTPSGSATGSPG